MRFCLGWMRKGRKLLFLGGRNLIFISEIESNLKSIHPEYLFSTFIFVLICKWAASPRIIPVTVGPSYFITLFSEQPRSLPWSVCDINNI